MTSLPLDHQTRSYALQRRWLRGLGLLLAVSLGGAGCAGSAADPSSPGATRPIAVGSTDAVVSDVAPVSGGKVVYAVGADTNGWNPGANEFSSAGLLVGRAIFDTVTAFADDLSVRPYLATKLDHSTDYRTWTITLRPDVKMHNGKILTADMLKQDQEYFKSSPIFGGAYRAVDSFSTSGPLDLVVHLSDPWVSFPSVLTGQLGMVADPDWVKSNDGLHPVGTGPFTMVSWQPGGTAVVKKNPEYWQKDANGIRYPYLDEIDFTVMTDGTTRGAALRSGSADIIQAGDAQQIIDFRAQHADGFQVLWPYAMNLGAAGG